MNRKFTASCDRIECEIAVLIEDENEKEHKIYSPLSGALVEGGVYECTLSENRIVSVFHLTDAERERREASRKLLARLTQNNK